MATQHGFRSLVNRACEALVRAWRTHASTKSLVTSLMPATTSCQECPTYSEVDFTSCCSACWCACVSSTIPCRSAWIAACNRAMTLTPCSASSSSDAPTWSAVHPSKCATATRTALVNPWPAWASVVPVVVVGSSTAASSSALRWYLHAGTAGRNRHQSHAQHTNQCTTDQRMHRKQRWGGEHTARKHRGAATWSPRDGLGCLLARPRHHRWCTQHHLPRGHASMPALAE